MLKGGIGLFTVFLVAGSTLAYAQEASRPRLSQADLKARIDMRMDMAKGALQLTPDQTKLWVPVEDALRTGLQARYARIAAIDERVSQHREIDPGELLRGRADALTQRAANLKKLADAWEPLYKSFNAEQKERVRFLAQRVAPGLRVAVETGRLRGFNEGATRTGEAATTGGTVGIAPR